MSDYGTFVKNYVNIHQKNYQEDYVKNYQENHIENYRNIYQEITPINEIKSDKAEISVLRHNCMLISAMICMCTIITGILTVAIWGEVHKTYNK